MGRKNQIKQTKQTKLILYFRQLGEQEVLKNQNISKLQSTGSVTKQLETENETYR